MSSASQGLSGRVCCLGPSSGILQDAGHPSLGPCCEAPSTGSHSKLGWFLTPKWAQELGLVCQSLTSACLPSRGQPWAASKGVGLGQPHLGSPPRVHSPRSRRLTGCMREHSALDHPPSLPSWLLMSQTAGVPRTAPCGIGPGPCEILAWVNSRVCAQAVWACAWPSRAVTARWRLLGEYVIGAAAPATWSLAALASLLGARWGRPPD